MDSSARLVAAWRVATRWINASAMTPANVVSRIDGLIRKIDHIDASSDRKGLAKHCQDIEREVSALEDGIDKMSGDDAKIERALEHVREAGLIADKLRRESDAAKVEKLLTSAQNALKAAQKAIR